MTIDGNHVTADEGKWLRRKSDGWVAGAEIFLGYTYYIGGVKIDPPLLELPEHYEEFDKPEEEVEPYE